MKWKRNGSFQGISPALIRSCALLDPTRISSSDGFVSARCLMTRAFGKLMTRDPSAIASHKRQSGPLSKDHCNLGHGKNPLGNKKCQKRVAVFLYLILYHPDGILKRIERRIDVSTGKFQRGHSRRCRGRGP